VARSKISKRRRVEGDNGNHGEKWFSSNGDGRPFLIDGGERSEAPRKRLSTFVIPMDAPESTCCAMSAWVHEKKAWGHA